MNLDNITFNNQLIVLISTKILQPAKKDIQHNQCDTVLDTMLITSLLEIFESAKAGKWTNASDIQHHRDHSNHRANESIPQKSQPSIGMEVYQQRSKLTIIKNGESSLVSMPRTLVSCKING